jgi:hypothetical protein
MSNEFITYEELNDFEALMKKSQPLALVTTGIYSKWSIDRIKKFHQFIQTKLSNAQTIFRDIKDTDPDADNSRNYLKRLVIYYNEICSELDSEFKKKSPSQLTMLMTYVSMLESRLTALEAENAGLKARVDKLEK